MASGTTTRLTLGLGPGRPMDPNVDRSILEATRSLLETQSVGELTMNGIAKAAGVSRPAVYRRWSSPREVALEAFLERTSDEVPTPDAGTAAEALSGHIVAMVRFMRGRGGRIAAELVGDGQGDPEMLAMYRSRLLEPRRREGRRLIERGVEGGEFDPDIDVDIAIDLYAGPIYFRTLAGHAALTDDFAQKLADRVVQAVRRVP